MLTVAAGETVRLRFRAQTPDGSVVRPPAATAVTVLKDHVVVGYTALNGAPEWDGRQWAVSVDTRTWPPGDYEVRARVTGSQGTGEGSAEIRVKAR